MVATTFLETIDNLEEFDMPTNSQYDAQLEVLAKLIEAKAKSVEEAAQIVREAKTVSEDNKRVK